MLDMQLIFFKDLAGGCVMVASFGKMGFTMLAISLASWRLLQQIHEIHASSYWLSLIFTIIRPGTLVYLVVFY